MLVKEEPRECPVTAKPEIINVNHQQHLRRQVPREPEALHAGLVVDEPSLRFGAPGGGRDGHRAINLQCHAIVTMPQQVQTTAEKVRAVRWQPHHAAVAAARRVDRALDRSGVVRFPIAGSAVVEHGVDRLLPSAAAPGGLCLPLRTKVAAGNRGQPVHVAVSTVSVVGLHPGQVHVGGAVGQRQHREGGAEGEHCGLRCDVSARGMYVAVGRMNYVVVFTSLLLRHLTGPAYLMYYVSAVNWRVRDISRHNDPTRINDGTDSSTACNQYVDEL